MKIAIRQQFIIWISVGAVALLGGLWAIAFPLRAQLQSQATRIEDARVTIELNSRQQQNLSSLKNQVDQILDNTKILTEAFFERTAALDFLEYVEELAAKEKLKLSEPQLASPARVSPDTATTYTIEEKPFHFEVQGEVPQLMRFLSTLESHKSYILITALQLQHASPTSESTLSLEGTIPWH